MPGEAGKQCKDAFEGCVCHGKRLAHAWRMVCVEFQLVVQEQAAVEVWDLPGERFGLFAAVGLGFGEGLKKQGVEELSKKAVRAALLALRQFRAQVVGIAAIKE